MLLFRKIILLYLFLLCTVGVVGQINVTEIEQQFGKGELVLKKRISIRFFLDKESNTYKAKVNHQVQKIVINNKNETKNGLIQIPFNEFQELKLLRARYFELDSIGNKILKENVKVKYADVKDYFINNIFYSDLKVKQFKCSVDLKDTYLVDYSYELIYSDLKFLTSFYFQNHFEGVQDVKITVFKNPHINFSIYPYHVSDIEISESDKQISYQGLKLKRYKESEFSIGGSYYLPHIVLSVHHVIIEEDTTTVLNTIDDLYNWYYSLINQLEPDTAVINNLCKTIINDNDDDVVKIDKIFKWVQQNINYVAFENGIAGFKPMEADRVAYLKFGDCKGIANLLVNLLKAAGFDARHVWLGTKSIQYNYDIPSLVVDNHMICGLFFENKIYYLDGTSKTAFWNNVPSHIEGKEVLIGNGNYYTIGTIKESSAHENNIRIKGVLDLTVKNPIGYIRS